VQLLLAPSKSVERMLITRSTQKVILFMSVQEPLIQSACGHHQDSYASFSCAKVYNIGSYKETQ
jgi:hypothetical protein